jgi:NAD+ diphosphatase
VKLGFTGGTFDRADPLRNDAAALAGLIADPRARLMRLTRLEPELDETGGLAWGSLAEAHDDGELVLLGLDETGRPHFACVNPDEAIVTGRAVSLFRVLDRIPAADAAHYAAARSVVDWHMRHRFCAACGTPTETFRAGWGRTCPNCAAVHFPRVDPVVIMLAELGDRVLMGRGPGWPPGRYSALAGFVEPGESIEEAVARETAEETGVRVRDVRYIASQPWPFASSLMIACIAVADDDTIRIDPNELEDAIWVTRDEVRAVLAGEPGPFAAPPPYAIAFNLLTVWAAGG